MICGWQEGVDVGKDAVTKRKARRDMAMKKILENDWY
jgi:hypothetical protein